MDFTSSITVAFKDSFSSVFNEVKDSFAVMKGVLDEINQNQSMNNLAADMDQSSKIAGTLDTSFRSIQVSAGLANQEMADMRRELLSIDGRAAAGLEAVARAFDNVASSVSDASKHMAVMNATVLFSKANNADLSEVARSVQLESTEAKTARLDSAPRSLQAQIGQDINVVSSVMSSPADGAISRIAAVTVVAGKSILDMGSNALNAAVQITTLAANIVTTGGIAKTFQSGIGLAGASLRMLAAPFRVAGSGIISMGKSIIGALPAIGSYIASMWASVTATIAAIWPILAIVAGVALLAAGVYLLIKNWDAVSGFFVGLWNKITGIFSAAWDWIKNLLFGTSDWILAAVAIFMPIVGIPALIIKHWDVIKEFFVNLWNDPKAAILGFIDWVSSKVEAIVAPFKVAGDMVGGVFNKVGGFFKWIVGGGEESGTALNDAFASGIDSNASAPGEAFNNSLQTVSRQMPHSDAPEGPLSTLTSSGRALTETFASGMDESDLREKASLVFSAAMPQGETVEFPSGEGSSRSAGSQAIHIQNLYLQADDCENLLDFVRMIMHSVNRPQEVAV